MTPQEKDMITQLLGRLKQAGGQPQDPEAAALIRQAMQAQPDAPYLLVQTALIQTMSLEGAQARIAELEREVAQARESTAKPTSFLGGLLGGGRPAPQPVQPMGRPGSVPQTGGYGQQPPPGFQPQQAGPMGGGGSSFLRTAAMTAAGVAGGALLFHGLSSMFSGRGAGGGSQSFMGGGGQPPAASPWGNPQASAGDPAAMNSGAGDQGYDSASPADSAGWDSGSDSGGDAGGWDDSGGGFSSDEEF
ncbi:MAG: DUF2076 domain-containing protein [Alphaproteobacteria bacterium]|nr:DUF2076 domain-containing protein [Alphaproteobacteria bacterium]